MRHKRIQDVIDEMTKDRIGLTQKDAQHHQVCTWCGNSVTMFRNQLSQKEYGISGFCQKCQDDTFGED